MPKVGASKRSTLLSHIIKNRYLYFLLVPAFLYYFIFKYVPIYGMVMAFQDFSPAKGFGGSAWVGLEHFHRLFAARDFYRVFRNTLLISFLKLFFGFPIPIILALLLNEVGNYPFKRSVQTIIYLPRFISWIVVAGIVYNLTAIEGGLINEIIKAFGGEPIVFLADKRYFRGLLVITDIWKNAGWRTIIYLAALTGINPELYESAKIDGANRWQQTLHITLPSITEVIAIILILSVGDIMRIGFEQVFAMYNPAVYEVADIFQTYVYRIGLLGAEFSYAAAIGIFNSVIAFAIVIIVNQTCKLLGSRGMF
jgi:putative aldouronate transport system permease protein